MGQDMIKSNQLAERRFQPRYLIWAIALHFIGLVGGYVLYQPWAFTLAFGLAALTAYSMGIFHHMYLSHSSFQAQSWLENLGIALGTLTWRGPMAAPLRYVAMHRIHHRYSDKQEDPHSPSLGIAHALLAWNWNHSEVFQNPDQYRKLVPKKYRQNYFIRFCDDNVNLLQLAYGLSLFAVGNFAGGPKIGLTLVVYGVFVKTLIVVYSANLVDVINHTLGYRNYKTGDHSTNSFIMAALHLGGAISWHNNHHARAKYFSVKKKWWEFDVHYQILRILALFGAVTNIKTINEVGKSKPLRQNAVEA